MIKKTANTMPAKASVIYLRMRVECIDLLKALYGDGTREVMRSVPPRVSGWVTIADRQLPISDERLP